MHITERHIHRGVITLCLVTLAASPAAHAQTLTLNSDDAVTVDGTGTHGTVGGSAVSNNTTAYNDTPFGSYAAKTNGTSRLTLGNGGSLTDTQNGYGLIAAGNGAVTVNGGLASGIYGGLCASGSGAVMVLGGSLASTNMVYSQGGNGLLASGSGSVTVMGGILTGTQGGAGLDASGSGAVTVNNGTFGVSQFGYGLIAAGTGLVTINGGTFTAVGENYDGLIADNSSRVSITGGTITGAEDGIGLAVDDSSTVTISGGTITDTQRGTGLLISNGSVTIIGGSIISDLDGVDVYGGIVTIAGGSITAGVSGLFASKNGTINLFSQADTPFLINGIPMNNTSLAANGFKGTISGTLLNGEAFSTTFLNTGTINLNVGTPPAPEPPQFAAFGLGILGLSALVLRARRRVAKER